MSVEDINAKPKIMRKVCLQKMRLQARDWFIDSEVLIKARRHDWRIANVFVNYRERKAGKSNIRFGVVFEFLKNLILARLGII